MSVSARTVKPGTSAAWDCAAEVYSLSYELEAEAYGFYVAGFNDYAAVLKKLALTIRSEAKLMAANIPSSL